MSRFEKALSPHHTLPKQISHHIRNLAGAKVGVFIKTLHKMRPLGDAYVVQYLEHARAKAINAIELPSLQKLRPRNAHSKLRAGGPVEQLALLYKNPPEDLVSARISATNLHCLPILIESLAIANGGQMVAGVGRQYKCFGID